MAIWVRNFQSAVLVCESLLKLHCTFLMHLLGAGKYDVNVVCMDAKAIQTLNGRYRAVDSPTDVLSFPYHEVNKSSEILDVALHSLVQQNKSMHNARITEHQYVPNLILDILLQNLQPGEVPLIRHQWDSNLGDIILGMPIIQEACRADKVTLTNRLPVIITHGL